VALPAEKRHPFEVTMEGGNLIVTSTKLGFRAVYYKPIGQPQLSLRERTKTDNHKLLADARKAVNDKACELGWIV